MILALLEGDPAFNLGCGGLFFLGLLGLIVWIVNNLNKGMSESKRRESLPPEERAREEAERNFGPTNPAMICPHCQTQGKIRTKPIEKKAGISGGKATAAVLTGGVSILATGLSQKEGATQARCEGCNNTWSF
jgi:hypothetical protein